MKLWVPTAHDWATATNAYMDVCEEMATNRDERPTLSFCAQVPTALQRAEEGFHLLPACWQDELREETDGDAAVLEALSNVGVILGGAPPTPERLTSYQAQVATEAIEQFVVRTIIQHTTDGRRAA